MQIMLLKITADKSTFIQKKQGVQELLTDDRIRLDLAGENEESQLLRTRPWMEILNCQFLQTSASE